MNPKISRLKAEREKNDGKIAMLQSRNHEIDEDIIKLENEDIVGLARATGMTMEELAQYLMHVKSHPFVFYCILIIIRKYFR